MHLHRAAPNDGTTPPSCDADGIVPLRPSDSAVPGDAAPPRNVVHSDTAPPRNVAHCDAVPLRNVARSNDAPPRNIVHSDAAPRRDITNPRRSMEQRVGGYGNTGCWEEGRKWKEKAGGTCTYPERARTFGRARDNLFMNRLYFLSLSLSLSRAMRFVSVSFGLALHSIRFCPRVRSIRTVPPLHSVLSSCPLHSDYASVTFGLSLRFRFIWFLLHCGIF